jgi:hypothetical protein
MCEIQVWHLDEHLLENETIFHDASMDGSHIHKGDNRMYIAVGVKAG